MLTHETMGVFALGILWINTLLVAAAALGRARELGALRHGLTAGGLVRGRLVSGAAALVVEQVGRQASGKKDAVLWHDRSHASHIDVVVARDGGEEMVLRGLERPMVWLDRAEVEEAARPPASAFERVYGEARKARGSTRTLEITVSPERAVWASRSPALVATIDPIAWCKRREAALSFGFVPAILALAAAVTAVALCPPAFGTVSTIGGMLGLAFFLLVLPAGTAMRDWARAPHERFVRGRWERATEACRRSSAQGGAASSASLQQRIPVE